MILYLKGTVYAVCWWGDVLFTGSALSDVRGWRVVKTKPKMVTSQNNIHDGRLISLSFLNFTSKKFSFSATGVYCLATHGNKVVTAGADTAAIIWNIQDSGKFRIDFLIIFFYKYLSN